ncbi:MAG: winged helix-turn-helix transcriptional regulator [Hymenobacter sp.]|nr:winged helix-turn-helix transcriptional regulator [Hymenobacter sp.]
MSIEARRDVYQAIADPTRRQIIGLLAGGGLSLNAIASKFEVSRPAISQQVKILIECGLVVVRPEGRERICEVRLDGLADVAEWITQYRELWDGRLSRLDSFLQQPISKTPKR